MATSNRNHSGQYAKQFKSLIFRWACVLLVTFTVWGGAVVPSAVADSVGVGSDKAGDVMLDRAAKELDRTAGAGTSDFVEGAVDGSVGKVKRGFGEAKGQLDDSLEGQLEGAANRVEGATDQLKGKAKRDAGRLKGKASDAGDDIEESTESIVDAVKDFFN
ncbi:MAG: hypothetical protein WBG63_06945 [Phormidesmis sp.]